MKNTGSSSRYAKALFAEALEKKEILACQQGLQEIARTARLRESLAKVLSHPFIPITEKRSIIHAALGEYATPLLERFLMLLVEKKRFCLLLNIVEEFQSEVDRYQNVQPLRVRTAYPLTDIQRKQLQEHLEGWLSAKVRMDIQVDPRLIGGVVIQTRDKECDISLRGHLRRMERTLYGNSI